MARRELRQKIQLKVGEVNATLVTHHNSFVEIVSAALGGSDGGSGAPAPAPGMAGVKDLGAGHGSPEEAVAAINRALMIA